MAFFCVVSIGCESKNAAPRQESKPTAQRRRDPSLVLQRNIAATLNALPRTIDTQLEPPQVVLDSSKTTDGKEALAVCDVNPAVPQGPVTFFAVPAGNVDFKQLGVQPGDVIRYYATFDQESLDRGIEQRTYLELVVRRLGPEDPRTTLLVEGGLSGPMPFPQRLEVWRYSDRRLNEIRSAVSRYVQRPRRRLAWEPTPDERALEQLLERLNQWLRNQTLDLAGWELDSRIEKVRSQFAEDKEVVGRLQGESLTEGKFDLFDVRQLQQAVWLRDISQWARGDGLSDLEIASALFDWTVRNVQLDPPTSATQVAHQPWQALAYGHGTAVGRAWVFVELCRHQQIDAVVLGLSAGEYAARYWLPAVLEEGQLYLFDPRLGLPIPNSDGSRPATLSEVLDESELLRRLDLDGADYPIPAGALEEVAAYVVASPLQLSKRAARLEAVLEGQSFVILSAQTKQLASEVSKLAGINTVELWPIPAQAIADEVAMGTEARQFAGLRQTVFAQRPRLWKARTLQFQGTKPIPPSEANDPLAEPRRGHREATRLYQDPRIRPPDDILRRLAPAKQLIYGMAKADAAYWLGLLKYDQGRFKVARFWLEDQTLGAASQGFWAQGARYNLARTCEQLGDFERAIELLESDEQSPQRHGNLLRARQLRERLEPVAEAPAEQ